VRVSTPGGVKSKGSTQENAVKQARLLNAVEHGWKPTGKPASKSPAQKKARATMTKKLFG